MKKISFISREQDYALRITAYLAGLPKNKFIPISKISEKLFVSKNFAARIIHKLNKAKITASIQGKYGGIYLKVNPSKLTIYDVLYCIGFKVKFNDCLKESFFCELMFSCKFHSFFVNEEKLFFEKLKSQKILDYIIRDMTN